MCANFKPLWFPTHSLTSETEFFFIHWLPTIAFPRGEACCLPVLRPGMTPSPSLCRSLCVPLPDLHSWGIPVSYLTFPEIMTVRIRHTQDFARNFLNIHHVLINSTEEVWTSGGNSKQLYAVPSLIFITTLESL